jgi:hypothetical protein
MPSAGFEPAIPTTERLQIYALDLMVTGIWKFPEYITLSTVALGGNAAGATVVHVYRIRGLRLHNLH